MEDTNFSSSTVDPTYDTGLFGSDLAGNVEAERSFGIQPIPRFEHYLLTPIGFEALTSEKGPSYGRMTLKVVSGPEGTVGRQVQGNLFFHINPVKTNKDGSTTVRSREQIDAAKKELGDTLLKVARVLGLSRATPSDGSTDAIAAWGSQAVEAGATFVGEVRIEKGNPEKGYAPRNSVAWRSIAALNDAAKDDNGKPVAGKSAGDYAAERIAAYNKRKAEVVAKGTTARSHGPAKPTGFSGR